MKNRTVPSLLLFALLSLRIPVQAQSNWSGIIAPNRATDWSTAGAVIATNGLFERTFQSLLIAGGGEGRTIRALVNERDRPALDALIAHGAHGESDWCYAGPRDSGE